MSASKVSVHRAIALNALQYLRSNKTIWGILALSLVFVVIFLAIDAYSGRTHGALVLASAMTLAVVIGIASITLFHSISLSTTPANLYLVPRQGVALRAWLLANYMICTLVIGFVLSVTLTVLQKPPPAEVVEVAFWLILTKIAAITAMVITAFTTAMSRPWLWLLWALFWFVKASPLGQHLNALIGQESSYSMLFTSVYTGIWLLLGWVQHWSVFGGSRDEMIVRAKNIRRYGFNSTVEMRQKNYKQLAQTPIFGSLIRAFNDESIRLAMRQSRNFRLQLGLGPQWGITSPALTMLFVIAFVLVGFGMINFTIHPHGLAVNAKSFLYPVLMTTGYSFTPFLFTLAGSKNEHAILMLTPGAPPVHKRMGWLSDRMIVQTLINSVFIAVVFALFLWLLELEFDQARVLLAAFALMFLQELFFAQINPQLWQQAPTAWLWVIVLLRVLGLVLIYVVLANFMWPYALCLGIAFLIGAVFLYRRRQRDPRGLPLGNFPKQ